MITPLHWENSFILAFFICVNRRYRSARNWTSNMGSDWIG
jgi:hypothetical protein